MKIILIMLAVLATVYFWLARGAHPAVPHPWFTPAVGEHQPLVFAHQGGEAIRPSNTLIAFEHAVALGADVLDMDMHMTRDGALVLMHDETVDRTTDGAGAIRALTSTELSQLDAAYRFTTDVGATFPYRGQGTPVPLLETLFQKYPGKRFGIEIKQTPPAVAKPFCAMIRKYGMQEKVLVSSFAQNMDAFRAECPEVATSATQNEVIVFFLVSQLRLERAYTPVFQSLQVPEYQSGLHVLNERFIAAARDRGLPLQPWTINTQDDLKRMLALKVDGINTDYPDRLLALLK